MRNKFFRLFWKVIGNARNAPVRKAACSVKFLMNRKWRELNSTRAIEKTTPALRYFSRQVIRALFKS